MTSLVPFVDGLIQCYPLKLTENTFKLSVDTIVFGSFHILILLRFANKNSNALETLGDVIKFIVILSRLDHYIQFTEARTC